MDSLIEIGFKNATQSISYVVHRVIMERKETSECSRSFFCRVYDGCHRKLPIVLYTVSPTTYRFRQPDNAQLLRPTSLVFWRCCWGFVWLLFMVLFIMLRCQTLLAPLYIIVCIIITRDLKIENDLRIMNRRGDRRRWPLKENEKE